jgi:TonB family protein
MCPRPTSWPEASDRPGVDVSSRAAAFAQSLEHHVQGGLSPELALDLALNELVMAATAATHASAAALALARGQEMVCRATTGEHAPDLGMPLKVRSGLSGACIRFRKPQHCTDTECDERVDATASRRLGVRSILVVPVLDGESPVGIIEVFSAQPSAFSQSDEALLQGFALDCVRLQRLTIEVAQRPPHKPEKEETATSTGPAVPMRTNDTDKAAGSESVLLKAKLAKPNLATIRDVPARPSAEGRSRTETWTAVLATLVILAAIGLAILIGSRTGWLRALPRSPARVETSQFSTTEPPAALSATTAETAPPTQPSSEAPVVRPSPPPVSDGLIVYERGKVIFRSKSTSPATGEGAGFPAGNARHVARVWLAPNAAEARLRDRVEPEYPADARAAHRSGDVTLQILVREDGSVASVRTINGDPLLAEAAAAAVRNWRYEPYQLKSRPREFQTDVTLRFSQ